LTVRTPEGFKNVTVSPLLIDSLTLDQRQATQNSGNSFVPAGTSATAHPLRFKTPSRLKFLAYWAVDPPAGDESVAIRIFRFPPGGFQQATTVHTVALANFQSNQYVDLSAHIIPGIEWGPLDIVACSYVHAGTQQMDPLITMWSFEPLVAGAVAAAGALPPVLPAVWPPV